MINSKWMRILCYIAMGFSCLVALILLIFGLGNLADENKVLGIVFVILGILLPIITSISLYPIFALSLIETNTSEMKEQLNLIVALLKLISQGVHKSQNEPTPAPPQSEPLISFTPPPTNAESIDSLNDAINFINQEYNLDLDITDNLITLQEKILKADSLEYKGQIFKKRILEATTLNEVYSVIKMHRTINK